MGNKAIRDSSNMWAVEYGEGMLLASLEQIIPTTCIDSLEGPRLMVLCWGGGGVGGGMKDYHQGSHPVTPVKAEFA